jgi:hypothetical protein
MIYSFEGREVNISNVEQFVDLTHWVFMISIINLNYFDSQFYSSRIQKKH